MNLLFANTSRFVSHGIVVTSWRLLTLLVSALIFNLSAISVWDLTESKLVYCTVLILVIAILAVIVYRILRKRAYNETVFQSKSLIGFFKDTSGVVAPREFICGIFTEIGGGISLELLASRVIGESHMKTTNPKEVKE